jgi:tetratricopeptide (TPR) repeat protein
MLLGRYEEAEQQLQEAFEVAANTEKQARIEALQGELALKQGLIDKSIETLESGLRRLGVWVPRSRLGLFYGLIRESLIQCSHSLMPFLLHRKSASLHSHLTIRLFVRISNPYIFQDTLKLMWGHLASVNHAERVPRFPLLAYVYGFHACVASMLGWTSRGRRYDERAMQLASEFNDVFGQGLSSNYIGVGCYASARYEEGLTRLSKAIDAFERAGDIWESHLARFHLGCCLFGLGELSKAIAQARKTFESSARLGDSRTLCSGYLWARATRGNVPFEKLKSCFPNRPDDVMSTVHGIMAEGHWHTYHGRTEEALQAFERAAQRIRESLCVNSHTILVLPELAAALRRHAAAIKDQDSRQCAQLLRRSDRLSKWSTRIMRLFPAAYPLALRERSLILSDLGKTKRALKFAEKSCSVAQKQKARYEYAQSQLVRGKLAKELGRSEGEEQIRTAQAALADFDRMIEVAGTDF